MNKFKKYISSTLLFIAIAAIIPAYSIEENSQIQDGEQQQVAIVAPTTWYKLKYCGVLAMGLLALVVYMDKVVFPVQLRKMFSDIFKPSLSAFEQWVQKEDKNVLRKMAYDAIVSRYYEDVDLAKAFGGYDPEKMKNDLFNAYRKETEKLGEEIFNIAFGSIINDKNRVNIYVITRLCR